LRQYQPVTLITKKPFPVCLASPDFSQVKQELPHRQFVHRGDSVFVNSELIAFDNFSNAGESEVMA